MDFETTGLIPSGVEDSRPVPGDLKRSISNFVTRCAKIHDTPESLPQITEMCFLSVPRQNFDIAAQNLHNEANFGDDTKLLSNIASNVYTSQCKPNLHPNEWAEYERIRKITPAIHLSQEDLRFKNSFKEEWPLVQMFLKTQKTPACLIAHNGMKFDFRILYGELMRNKLLEEYPIPDGVFFLDSYLVFLDLEKTHLDNLATITTSVNWEKVSEVIQLANATTNHVEEVVEPGPSGVWNNPGLSSRENIPISPGLHNLGARFNTPPRNMENQNGGLSSINHEIPRTTGLTTPPRGNGDNQNGGISPRKGRKLFNDDEVLPLALMDTGKWSPAKRRRTEKSFFRKVSESKWEFNELRAKEYFFRGNFKLENLFKQVTKSQYNAHHAHADCEALLQVCVAYGEDFGTYMDRRKEEISIFQNK